MKTNIIITSAIAAMTAIITVSSVAASADTEPTKQTSSVCSYSVLCDDIDDGTTNYGISVSGDIEGMDLSKLTEDEQNELQGLMDKMNSIIDEICPEGKELTDKEVEAILESHKDEIEKIEPRINELTEKAGWDIEKIIADECGNYDEEPFCFSYDVSDNDDDNKDSSETTYFSCETSDDDDFDISSMDCSKLTLAEKQELTSLMAKVDEIFDEICPADKEMIDEEVEKAFEAHKSELDPLQKRINELTEKAGWFAE